MHWHFMTRNAVFVEVRSSDIARIDTEFFLYEVK
jgi:hypothetical protein